MVAQENRQHHRDQSLSERCDHLGDDGFGFCPHLGVGRALNRVLDENAFGAFHAKRAGLRLRRVLELG